MEYLQILQWLAGMAVTVIYAVLWAIGGRPGGRVFRRFIAPLVYCIGLLLLMLWIRFNWWYLACFPLIFLNGFIPYGKTWQRILWGIYQCIIPLPIVLISGAWVIYGFQCFVGLTSTVMFGLLNPLPAPEEEATIRFNNSFMIPFML